jgi:predicted DNA-binding transcriptional regulator AlpA
MVCQLELQGGFPATLKLGVRAVSRVESEINGWLETRVGARVRHVATEYDRLQID